MNGIKVSEELSKNFHLFWDNFPFPVMLIHKDRTILDVNKAAQQVGYPVGTRCIDIGDKKIHAGCKANEALQKNQGVRDVAYFEIMDKVINSYWVPLADYDDIYVHFAIDITEYASDKLLPQNRDQFECM